MSEQKTISPRAWAELLLLALIWGGSFLSIRLALDGMGVLTTVALRVFGAAVVLWVYVLVRRLPLPAEPRLWGRLFLMGMMNNAVPFCLITWGELHIPSGLAAILNAATAILGVLLAAMVFRDERLSPRKALGVMLGFLGVATIIGLRALEDFDLASLGQIAVLGAACSYALSGAFGRAYLRGLSPQVIAAGALAGATLVLVPLALASEGLPSLAYAPKVWAGVLYLIGPATALAYLLYYRVLAMAGAGNVSLVTLLVAPFAVLFGALILGETLSPDAYAGFGLLAAGLLVIDGRLLRRRPPRPQETA